MWMSIQALAELCGCSEGALLSCLRAEAATFHVPYAGGFVRRPPGGVRSCRVTTTGLPHRIVFRLCGELTTEAQPWVPVLVVEHVISNRTPLSCGDFTAAVNLLLHMDWVRVSHESTGQPAMVRIMGRRADAAEAASIVASFME